MCQNTTAPSLPSADNNGITGTWSPSSISTATSGTTTYTFTPDGGQGCTIDGTLDITIDPEVVPDLSPIGPLCQNTTAPSLPSADNNGITGTWSPSTISTSTSGTTTYTFTPDAGQGCTIDGTLDITIDPEVVPDLSPIGPLCQNTTAPSLPTSDNNGITGTWSPSTISTATSGTTTYTFTPDANQGCTIDGTLDITIDPEVVPDLSPIGPLCQNTTAPSLPSADNNGITGTWSPSTISTATSGTTTYTFIPDANQGCTIDGTLDITIELEVVPDLSPIGPLCQNTTAPSLPSADNNGITGTWSPSTISTATSGTTTYTFTPDGGQGCTIDGTLDITIDPEVIPNLTAIGPLCQNSTAPTLPSADNNGITGTWSPSTINTSSAGTTTYTFTPDGGQGCTIAGTIDITIDPEVVPDLSPIGPLCQNTTAPSLPSADNNGITGTWSPSTISTSTSGTTTYTFTPDGGQGCTIDGTLDITIDPEVIPNLTAIGPLCQNTTAPTLPSADNNGITGTWSPSTINTSSAGTTTYTFTPGRWTRLYHRRND